MRNPKENLKTFSAGFGLFGGEVTKRLTFGLKDKLFAASQNSVATAAGKLNQGIVAEVKASGITSASKDVISMRRAEAYQSIATGSYQSSTNNIFESQVSEAAGAFVGTLTEGIGASVSQPVVGEAVQVHLDNSNE